MLRLATPTSVDLSVHRLPGVGAVSSTELVALINRPLATLLKGRNERPRSKHVATHTLHMTGLRLEGILPLALALEPQTLPQ